MQIEEFDVVIIGGGAAGYFTAINIKTISAELSVCIIEKNKEVLQKVKVSGGGRCNVTNACFEPTALAKNYPRGFDVLTEPFKIFGPSQMTNWFNQNGIPLKTEADGRIFPESNTSKTIIDCFMNEAYRKQIRLFTLQKVVKIENKKQDWLIETDKELTFKAKNLVVASGSDKWILEMIQKLDVEIVPQVPSLFTFNIKDESLRKLQGISFDFVKVNIKTLKNSNDGPFLVTHWGVSGPAVLKLSAWAARELNVLNYNFKIQVNWLNIEKIDSVISELKKNINEIPKKNVIANPMFNLQARFWKYICEKSNFTEHLKWAEMGKKSCLLLATNLAACEYVVEGKSTFKDEFVTAGGVSLSEIDLKTYAALKYPNLFFAGEVLNIDGITGGFNFQAAWTSGWIVAQNFKK